MNRLSRGILLAVSILACVISSAAGPETTKSPFADYSFAYRLDDEHVIFYFPITMDISKGLPTCSFDAPETKLPARLFKSDRLCTAPESVVAENRGALVGVSPTSRWMILTGGSRRFEAKPDGYLMEGGDMCGGYFYPRLRPLPEALEPFTGIKEKYFLVAPANAAPVKPPEWQPDWLRNVPAMSAGETTAMKSLLRQRLISKLRELRKKPESYGNLDGEAVTVWNALEVRALKGEGDVEFDRQFLNVGRTGEQLVFTRARLRISKTNLFMMSFWSQPSSPGRELELREAFVANRYFLAQKAGQPVDIGSAGQILNLFDVNDDGRAELLLAIPQDFTTRFLLLEYRDGGVSLTGLDVIAGCSDE